MFLLFHFVPCTQCCQFLWIVNIWLPLRNYLVLCTLCCQFLWIVNIWLPLRNSLVLCTLCCQFLWIVNFWLSLRNSLILCTLCCQFLWIVNIWLPPSEFSSLVYPMLPVSLDCQFLIAPSEFSNVYLVGLVLPSIVFCVLSCWRLFVNRLFVFRPLYWRFTSSDYLFVIFKLSLGIHGKLLIAILNLCMQMYLYNWILLVFSILDILKRTLLEWNEMQSRMGNPETRATLGTQDTGRIQTKQ